jgi:hypothetical protein
MPYVRSTGIDIAADINTYMSIKQGPHETLSDYKHIGSSSTPRHWKSCGNDRSPKAKTGPARIARRRLVQAIEAIKPSQIIIV